MPAYYTLTSTAPGAAPVSFTLPTGWHEVTMATYLRLLTPHPTDSLLSILSGLVPAVIDQLQADDVVLLADTLSFALDHTELLELPPSPGLPDVGSAPYGLLQLATLAVNNLPEGAPALAAGPYLAALYRMHQVWGVADDAKVAAAEAAILASPCTEVVADCFFLLKGYNSCMSGMSRTQTMPSNSKTPKWRLAWKKLANVSARSPPSTA